jgi:hypothetical protein
MKIFIKLPILSILLVDITFSMIFYPLGFYAAHKKSYKLFNYFTTFAIIGLAV